MKRLASAVLLCAAFGCGGRSEIPTLELGGPDGAQVTPENSKSPRETYEYAFDQFSRAHYNVRRNLDTRTQNVYGAREATGRIVKSLETMRSCVTAAYRAPFDPAIDRYAEWQKQIDTGTWGGSFLDDFDRSERELKAALSPSSVAILSEFPPSTPADAKTQTLSAEKVDVKTIGKGTPAEKPRSDDPAIDPIVTARVHYRSWSRSHDELVAAYKAKTDCQSKYQDLVASLQLLKGSFTGDKAAKLQIYLEYYADVAAKTKTFTELPEKTVMKDVVDELEVAGRVIRKEFNPDK